MVRLCFSLRAARLKQCLVERYEFCKGRWIVYHLLPRLSACPQCFHGRHP